MVVGGDGADAQEPSFLSLSFGPASRARASLRQKLQKRRGSGSFLKFWLVSENSVAAPSQRAVPSWGRERNECTQAAGRLRDPA